MAITDTADNVEWFTGSGADDVFTYDSTPTSGQTILLWIYRDNNNQDRNQSAASATGYTSRFHEVAANPYRGVWDILTKTSDGTETDVTVTWNSTIGHGNVWGAIFVDNIDIANATFTFSDASSAGNFAAAAKTKTYHFFGSHGNHSGAATPPTGDTLIHEDWNLGTYRGAGVYVAGANTAYSVPSGNTAVLTMSVDEDNDPPPDPVITSSTYTANPATTTVTFAGTQGNDPDGDPVTVQVRIDGGSWVDKTPAANAWTHDFTGLTPGDYLLEVQAIDDQGGTSGMDSITHSINDYAEGTIVDPADSATIAYNASPYTVTGTASSPGYGTGDTITGVNVYVDGVLAGAATDTSGGSWATWSYELDLDAEGLTEGDTFDLTIRVTDGSTYDEVGDTASLTWQAIPSPFVNPDAVTDPFFDTDEITGIIDDIQDTGTIVDTVEASVDGGSYSDIRAEFGIMGGRRCIGTNVGILDDFGGANTYMHAEMFGFFGEDFDSSTAASQGNIASLGLFASGLAGLTYNTHLRFGIDSNEAANLGFYNETDTTFYFRSGHPTHITNDVLGAQRFGIKWVLDTAGAETIDIFYYNFVTDTWDLAKSNARPGNAGDDWYGDLDGTNLYCTIGQNAAGNTGGLLDDDQIYVQSFMLRNAEKHLIDVDIFRDRNPSTGVITDPLGNVWEQAAAQELTHPTELRTAPLAKYAVPAQIGSSGGTSYDIDVRAVEADATVIGPEQVTVNVYDRPVVDITSHVNGGVLGFPDPETQTFSGTVKYGQGEIEYDPGSFGTSGGFAGGANSKVHNGDAYVMYSKESIHTRFSGDAEVPNAAQADNFVVVAWHAATEQWIRDATADHFFTPRFSDRLIWSIDYTGFDVIDDSATALLEVQDPINGINAGVYDTDMTITPDLWFGATDLGEWQIDGNYFTAPPELEAILDIDGTDYPLAVDLDGSWSQTVTTGLVRGESVVITLSGSDGTETATEVLNMTVATLPDITSLNNFVALEEDTYGSLVTDDWQIERNALLVGGDTEYSLVSIEGLLDHPDLRTSDTPMTRRHGMSTTTDYLAGRTITITLEVHADSQAAFETDIQNLKQAFSPSVGIQPMVFQIPGVAEGRKVRVLGKVRRLTAPVDREWYFNIPIVTIEVFCPDPRIYDNTLCGVTMDTDVTYSGSLRALRGAPENEGTFETEPVYVVIGDVADPYIIDNTYFTVNGINISFGNYDIADDVLVEYDTKDRVITSRGTTGLGTSPTNLITEAQLADKWGVLNPGVNSIELRHQDTEDPTFVILYRHAWI